MIKKNLFLVMFFISFGLFSQKDSIFNYLNYDMKVTSDLSEARFFETIVKKSDSIWVTKWFKINGKLVSFWYSKTFENKNKIGQFVSYDNNDSISKIEFYNEKGLRHGKVTSWFINRNKNFEGRYFYGKKEGVWSYYHYTGILATKKLFKNDTLVSSIHYNEKGLEIEKPKILERNPYFKKGEISFKNKVRTIFLDNLIILVSQKFEISFLIDVDGSLNNVNLYPKLQSDLEEKIIKSISAIKGWEPGISEGRKVPVKFKNKFTIVRK